MGQTAFDQLHRQPKILNYQMKMYRIQLSDRLIFQALLQQYVDDFVIFDFQSFDRYHQQQHKHERPLVDQQLKIARIFDKPAHVLVLKSMQNDVLALHSIVAVLVEQMQTFYQIWNMELKLRLTLGIIRNCFAFYPVLAAPIQSAPDKICGIQLL